MAASNAESLASWGTTGSKRGPKDKLGLKCWSLRQSRMSPNPLVGVVSYANYYNKQGLSVNSPTRRKASRQPSGLNAHAPPWRIFQGKARIGPSSLLLH